MVVMAGVFAIYGGSLETSFHLDDYALFSDHDHISIRVVVRLAASANEAFDIFHVLVEL